MTITEKVTISFEMPKEYNKAMEFKKQHPDYVENATSRWISYSISKSYSLDWSDNE